MPNIITYSVIFVLLVCGKGLSKKPNVLFIIIDDLKPAISSFGVTGAYTPNIDALAERSFVFKNAFAQQALCAPSRNSLLTSRRPDALRLYDFYNYWRKEVGDFTTLPQHFKENGYYTYSIGKVFHPGISSNFTDDYPYSWSELPFHPKTERYANSKVCTSENGGMAKNLICPVIVELQPGGTLPDLESLNEAVHFLRQRANITNRPYFLAVGFHKPHVPFKFPVRYLDLHPLDNITLPKNRWKPSLLPNVAWNPWTDIRLRGDIRELNISFPFGTMPDQMTKKIIQAYNAAVSYIDELVGKLIKEVQDDTIIILTSDHGWSLGEHGEFAKYSNFEEATKVPLLVHVPGLSNRKVVLTDLVELVDIFPTLVDLTRVSEPLETCPASGPARQPLICTEGESLVPMMVKKLLNQIYPGKSAIFTQFPRPGIFPTIKPNSDKPHLRDITIMGYSMKTRRYRYSEWVKFNSTDFTVDWTNVYGRELYDHLLDPKENMNLVDRSDLAPIIETLRTALILGWRHPFVK